MKKLLLITASLLPVSSILYGAVRADEAALFACINKYKEVGVSADAALVECKGKSLDACIKGLMGKKYVATSLMKGPEGYLIDLGSFDGRWIDGHEWRRNGCKAYEDGPSRKISQGAAMMHEWFRQGWCPSQQINLGGVYSLDDAKNACELKSMQEKD